jgi:hypothetical protein
MKHLKVFALIALFIPLKSFAVFNSEKELFSALANAGYRNIIKIPGLNGTPNIQMYTFDSEGNSQQENLGNFARRSSNAEVAIPELDVIFNKQAYLARDVVSHAYKVANVFLCYRADPNLIQALTRQHKSYSDCYIFPRNIDEVVNALKAARQIR